MPEVPYFFFFWLITLYALSLGEKSPAHCWAGAGFHLKCTALIKEWVLLIGEHKVIGKPHYELSLSGFRLLQMRGNSSIEF